MKVPLPPFSFIEKSFEQIDYSDCYMLCSTNIADISLEQSIHQFFYDYPAWIKWLFQLRLALPRIFRMSKSESADNDFFTPEINLVKGGKVSFFTVEDISSDEVMLKATDTHLDACISFRKHPVNGKCELTISTTVHFNNKFGKIYFFFIKPFHKLIIIALLRRTINNLL